MSELKKLLPWLWVVLSLSVCGARAGWISDGVVQVQVTSVTGNVWYVGQVVTNAVDSTWRAVETNVTAGAAAGATAAQPGHTQGYESITNAPWISSETQTLAQVLGEGSDADGLSVTNLGTVGFGVANGSGTIRPSAGSFSLWDAGGDEAIYVGDADRRLLNSSGSIVATFTDKMRGDGSGWTNLQFWVSAPASTNSAGVAGQIAYDGNYVYVCVSDNAWKRMTLASW